MGAAGDQRALLDFAPSVCVRDSGPWNHLGDVSDLLIVEVE